MFWKYQRPKTRASFRVLDLGFGLGFESGVSWGSEVAAEGGEGKWDLGLVKGRESNLGLVNGIWELRGWGDEEALVLRERGERKLGFLRGLDLREEMVVVEVEGGRRFKAIIFVAEVGTHSSEEIGRAHV